MKYNDLFDTKSKFYSKYRPKYSNEFIQHLCTHYFSNKTQIVVDVGCGTGILTKQILDCGLSVVGIEPNEEMLNEAICYLKEYDNFTAINTTAENTTLPDNFADMIVVGQAFHWFDLELFKKESKRILTQQGIVVLVWNRKCDCPMETDRKKIVEKYRSIQDSFNCSWDEREVGIASFFDHDFVKLEFDNDIEEDFQEFIGRTLSASHAINTSDCRMEEYLNDWKQFFEKYQVNNKITTKNQTIAFIGRPK